MWTSSLTRLRYAVRAIKQTIVCFTKCLLLQVMLVDNTDQTFSDLISGRTDAALMRSDAIAHRKVRGDINATFFKHLDAVRSASMQHLCACAAPDLIACIFNLTCACVVFILVCEVATHLLYSSITEECRLCQSELSALFGCVKNFWLARLVRYAHH